LFCSLTYLPLVKINKLKVTNLYYGLIEIISLFFGWDIGQKNFLFVRSRHRVHTLILSLFTKQKYCNIFCVMSVYKKTLFFSEFYQDTIDLLYKKYHTEKKFLSTFFLRFFYT